MHLEMAAGVQLCCRRCCYRRHILCFRWKDLDENGFMLEPAIDTWTTSSNDVDQQHPNMCSIQLDIWFFFVFCRNVCCQWRNSLHQIFPEIIRFCFSTMGWWESFLRSKAVPSKQLSNILIALNKNDDQHAKYQPRPHTHYCELRARDSSNGMNHRVAQHRWIRVDFI